MSVEIAIDVQIGKAVTNAGINVRWRVADQFDFQNAVLLMFEKNRTSGLAVDEG